MTAIYLYATLQRLIEIYFSMRSTTFKWIILVATIAIGLLVSVQLFWLNKIYNFEQKEFTTSVVKSIQGVYEDLELSNSQSTQLQKLIEQPNANSFLFRIDSIPTKDVLKQNLLSNLEAFGVFADCEVALYNDYTHQHLFEFYLPAAVSKHGIDNKVDLKIYSKDYPYIQLYFPYRNNYIINSMTWWIISSTFLLLLLVALGLSIFYLYRQKFLNEIQLDFIRNVTHEFQTPLTTLTVGLDAIARPGIIDQPAKLSKYTNLMQGQAAYLKQHMENLMEVMKAETSGLQIQKEPVVPNELIRKAIIQLNVMIEEKEAQIDLQLDPGNISIKAGSNSIYLVILNIISNAIKYSPTPKIIIQTSLQNDRYRISVKDNGIGIGRQYIGRLFKKFYRVPTGDIHNVKGLGLGLYFVKKVVDEHKGSIHVKSIVGTGTEFIIDLPIS